MSERTAFNFRLLLTPLDGAERTPVHVTGRDVSDRGIGFDHDEPIEHRRVRLTAADPRLDEIGMGDLEMTVTLRWCRFVGPGCYQSGGSVTRAEALLG